MKKGSCIYLFKHKITKLASNNYEIKDNSGKTIDNCNNLNEAKLKIKKVTN